MNGFLYAISIGPTGRPRTGIQIFTDRIQTGQLEPHVRLNLPHGRRKFPHVEPETLGNYQVSVTRVLNGLINLQGDGGENIKGSTEVQGLCDRDRSTDDIA